MLNTIWLIITALAFGGVVEKAGHARPPDRAHRRARRRRGGRLVATLVGSIFATNVVTADQYIAIVLPGRMFKSAFERRGYAPFVLSRTVGGVGHADVGHRAVEQLRRVHGRHARRVHAVVRAVRDLQLREPAARHRLRLSRHPHGPHASPPPPAPATFQPDLVAVASRCTPLPPLLVARAAYAAARAASARRKRRAPEVRPGPRRSRSSKRAGGETVALTGTVQAQTEINLAFRIDGRLVERIVNVGDTRAPGPARRAARLAERGEHACRRRARSSPRRARSSTEARNNFVRFRDLVAENAVSRASFEQAESMQKTAESQVESAQTQVTLATNRLDYTRLVVRRRRRGHGDGRRARRGRRRRAHDRAGRARRRAATPCSTCPRASRTRAPERRRITVALTSDPKVVATGTVREVAPRADPVTGTFRVRVRLTNPPPAMRLGTTVTGRIKLASARGHRDPAVGGRPLRPPGVRVGRRSEDRAPSRRATSRSARPIPVRVEVASGLNPGDVVVTAGVQALRPGQKVRLLETRQ